MPEQSLSMLQQIHLLHRLLNKEFFTLQRKKLQNSKQKPMLSLTATKSPLFKHSLSHICLSPIRNGSHDPNQEVNFRLPVGVRARLQPTLPSEYFGNAIQSEILTMKSRDQLEKGLEYVAREMNMNVGLHIDEKIRKFLESWRV
ncbi:Transferase [Melia azedarach]|uniref:Transferase n=1 Tax=Melia azedarach TaxID=155640 RepID=A0ACC1XUI7_MELAZ|nr:Transferase [Melia azedarach]